jgi:glutaminyl-peptide cyclotransferase
MPNILSVLVACLLVTGCSRETPGDQGKETMQQTPAAPASARFDANRAFGYLKAQVAFGPRVPNSEGHRRCLEYLVNTLRRSAESVRLQQFAEAGYDGEQLLLTNIIASFKPSLRQRILLCAHWDTRPRAERDEDPEKRQKPIPGANDGASGVAVLLEIAAQLKQSPPAIGVDIVLFDGEDYGKEGDLPRYLLGSQYFARSKPADYVPRFGILLDMVGDAALEIPQEKNSLRFAPDVVDMVWKTAQQLNVHQFIPEVGEEIHDDHIPLNRAGIKTIDLIDFNYPDETNRYWHTHQDTPEHCSAESLGAVGKVLSGIIVNLRP